MGPKSTSDPGMLIKGCSIKKGIWIVLSLSVLGIYINISGISNTSIKKSIVVSASYIINLTENLDVHLIHRQTALTHNQTLNATTELDSDAFSDILDVNSTLKLDFSKSIFPHWREHDKSSLDVFVYSAVVSNTTDINFQNSSAPKETFKYTIKLSAWEARRHVRTSMKCCYLWHSNETVTYRMNRKHYWKKWLLSSTQYHCPINSLKGLKGVYLEQTKRKCSKADIRYVKHVVPMPQEQQSFAVCLKIVYGNINVRLLVDWMEYYRQLKVDKVLVATFNVSKDAMQVLNYYVKDGFVEVRAFDFPWKDDKRNQRKIGAKDQRVFNDEQVVVFDCFERLHRYTYVSILDLDEFLLPVRAGDLKQMMKNLTTVYPKAAGFSFQSYLFIKDWGMSSRNNGSDIVQYFQRTRAVYTRQKNVILPRRLLDSTVHTHEFEPAPGFTREIPPETTAVLHHYRYCYSNKRLLCLKGKRFKDKSILRFASKFRERSNNVLKGLKLLSVR